MEFIYIHFLFNEERPQLFSNWFRMLSLDIMGVEFRLGYQETIRMVPYQQIVHVSDTRSRISFTWMSYTDKLYRGANCVLMFLGF